MTILFSIGGIKIVYEFCPYGDLKSFLKKNRQPIVNQNEAAALGYGRKQISGTLPNLFFV